MQALGWIGAILVATVVLAVALVYQVGPLFGVGFVLLAGAVVLGLVRSVDYGIPAVPATAAPTGISQAGRQRRRRSRR